MNSGDIQSQRSNSSTWTRDDIVYLSIVGLPLLLLTGMIVAGGVSWWTESKRADRVWKNLFPEIEHVNQAAFTHRYDKDRSTQETIRFNRVVDACESIASKSDLVMVEPSCAAADDPRYLIKLALPGQQNALTPIIAQFAAEAQPIIRTLEEIAESDEAIWKPYVFSQRSRQLYGDWQLYYLAQVIRIEFLQAFHEDDSQRAMNALRLFDRFFGPRVPTSFVTEEYLRVGSYQVALELVRQSLAYDFWSPQDLTALQEMLSAEFDWDQRWQEAIRGDLLLTYPWQLDREILRDMSASDRRELGLVSRMIDAVTTAPSERREVGQLYAQMLDLPGAGTQEHYSVIAELEPKRRTSGERSADRWLQFPLARGDWFVAATPQYCWNFASGLAVWENEQRWTRTAVAIKQFAAEHDRLPEALGALTAVGLPIEATLNSSGEPFEYHLNPTGDFAILGHQGGARIIGKVDASAIKITK